MSLLEELGLKGPYSKLSRADQLLYQREYRKRNAELYRERNRLKYDPKKAAESWKRYSDKNREKLRAKQREQYAIKAKSRTVKRKFLTDEERKEYQKTYSNRRYHSDPQYRVALRMRTRLNELLKKRNQKKSKTLKIDKKGLVEWIESKFLPGMTWANHGKEWHIDHIIPCAEFDLTDPRQVEQCFGYFNLQPLWKRDNIIKSDKTLKQQELSFQMQQQQNAVTGRLGAAMPGPMPASTNNA